MANTLAAQIKKTTFFAPNYLNRSSNTFYDNKHLLKPLKLAYRLHLKLVLQLKSRQNHKANTRLRISLSTASELYCLLLSFLKCIFWALGQFYKINQSILLFLKHSVSSRKIGTGNLPEYLTFLNFPLPGNLCRHPGKFFYFSKDFSGTVTIIST